MSRGSGYGMYLSAYKRARSVMAPPAPPAESSVNPGAAPAKRISPPGYAPHLNMWNDNQPHRDIDNNLPHNTRPNWSGPMPGQTVMGVDQLDASQPTLVAGSGRRRSGYGGRSYEERPYEVDQHGFVPEGFTAPSHDVRGASLPPGKFAAKDLYGSHGGMFGKTMAQEFDGTDTTPSDLGYTHDDVATHDRKVREVKAHWNRQPLVQMPASALVHTGQDDANTEGDDEGDQMEGRVKIDRIRRDLEEGGQIQKPAWIAKVNGRHFALDGHHRIVAAREAGAASYPARIWDMDAEAARQTSRPAVLPDNMGRVPQSPAARIQVD